MGAFPNDRENEVLDYVFGAVSPSYTGTRKLALFDEAVPGDDGPSLVNEVSGNNYARADISFGSASGGTIANDASIDFPQATPGAWGNVDSWAIFDSSGTPKMLAYGTLSSAKTVGALDEVSVAIGALQLSLD